MGRRLVVEADGGSRGNPGVAGYGALVRDPATGTVLAERAAPLGKQSNNVAEYIGLIAGLEAAALIDPGADVEVAMDSKLVVEQMSGRWKIKHEDMRRLATQARDLVAAFRAAGGSVRFRWIPREQNKAADKLSNDGMDGKTVVRDHVTDARAATPQAPTADRSGLDRARVVLVRHGVTAFTQEHRIDGRGGADPSLSPEGVAQAQAAAAAVRHLVGPGGAGVVTSSLTRAIQTGAAIAQALGVEPGVDPAWDEQDFGAWDGMSIGDLVAEGSPDLARFQAMRTDPGIGPPDGETHTNLVDRVVPAWRALLERGGTTVVVCHRKPIMVVLAEVLGLDLAAAWRIAAAPGSLTALESGPRGEITVVFTNRT